MGKSYSTDLRERVLQAIEEGMAKAQAHRTFHISRSTIDRWFALREQTSGFNPPPHRPTRTRQLGGEEGVFEHHVLFACFERNQLDA